MKNDWNPQVAEQEVRWIGHGVLSYDLFRQLGLYLRKKATPTAVMRCSSRWIAWQK